MDVYVLGVKEQRTEGIALADIERKINVLDGNFAVLHRNLTSSKYSGGAVGCFDFHVVPFFYNRNVWIRRIGYQLPCPSKENTENSELCRKF